MKAILLLLFTLVVNPQYSYFNIPYREDIGNRVWFMKCGTDTVEVIGMQYDSLSQSEDIRMFTRYRCLETNVNDVFQVVKDSLKLQ